MPESMLTALVLTPLIISIIATTVAWRLTSRPVLYFVVSVFSLLGVQALISPIALGIFFDPTSTLSEAAALEPFVTSVKYAAFGVVILGAPLLWWLFRGLRRA